MDDEGLDLCRNILEMLDELPDRAQEFRESVESKVLDIMRVAEVRQLSRRQMEMLENMMAGVERWLSS